MGKLTKEIVFVGRGHTRVRIGAADQAKLERVNAQIGFVAQALFECRATVLILQHIGCFSLSEGNIALIPGFVIGELIVCR